MSDRARKMVRMVLVIAAEVVLVLVTWGLIKAIIFPSQVGGPGR